VLGTAARVPELRAYDGPGSPVPEGAERAPAPSGQPSG